MTGANYPLHEVLTVGDPRYQRVVMWSKHETLQFIVKLAYPSADTFVDKSGLPINPELMTGQSPDDTVAP
jgi:hypothetical protein